MKITFRHSLLIVSLLALFVGGAAATPIPAEAAGSMRGCAIVRNGTPDADTQTDHGNANADCIAQYGRGGDDTQYISGGDGNDRLGQNGGDGNDNQSRQGGLGNDYIYQADGTEITMTGVEHGKVLGPDGVLFFQWQIHQRELLCEVCPPRPIAGAGFLYSAKFA